MGMEDVLRIDKILDFCDVPQLFVARDAFDTLYLCLLYDDETVYRYTGIRISTRRLESFLAGKADLRLLYLQPENEHEYYDVVLICPSLINHICCVVRSTSAYVFPISIAVWLAARLEYSGSLVTVSAFWILAINASYSAS